MARMKHLAEETERSGMAGNLDYTILDYAPGSVIYRYTPKERHTNLIGSLHGGIIASLLDTAMGAAVLTTLEAGESHTMTDLTVKFIRAVRDSSEQLTIHANVDHAGRRLFATEGIIKDSKDRIVARAIANAARL